MSLSPRERRILAEIEGALEQEDPELARRVAEINRAGWARDARPGSRGVRRRAPRAWMIYLAVALVIVSLLVAVLTT
ncbi:DUF3040 domain-containing protein [Nonomuraea deserti]|uniref:DUF3040 domain-containing protein n=1 Tax=Nonomuraea deserti TaxID=1848322 RepID=A0A4R4VWS4_9ACTN|nr:DUF3040 domain-containing protein [Nonomuraea deserti]TDD08797.1 DUF3040 domain-containing protein [Nonomuraea deserti]